MEITQELDLPDLKKTPGGWLALAVDSPRVAVMGSTRDEALANFQAERAIWRQLMAQDARETPADAG
jgi:hypothetical protein